MLHGFMLNRKDFHAGPNGTDTGMATLDGCQIQVGKFIVPANAGMNVAVFGDDTIG